MTYDTVITGSHIATPTGIIDKNLVLDEGKIVMQSTQQRNHLIFGKIPSPLICHFCISC